MRKIAAAGVVAAAAVALAGCSSAGDTATPPGASTAPASTSAKSTEPRTEAGVRAAAVDEFDSYASGDYGTAWDRFYPPAKKLISRANYERLFKLCPDTYLGVRFQIEKITMDSDHEAHVRVSRLVGLLTYQFLYESGRWLFVPAAETMHDYRTKTVTQMVAAQRAQGGCGK